MPDQVTLRASTGRKPGSREARRIRRQGGVPAVVYGRGVPGPVAVTVDHHDLAGALAGEAGTNVLISLDIDGRPVLTIPHIVERHPYRHEIRHVDFLTVSLTETMTTHIPVHFEGEPAGAIEGGMLSVETPTVAISSLPGEIPTAVTVDVSGWGLGHIFRVADLPRVPGVEYLGDPDEVIASVTRTSAAEAAAAETAAGEAEAVPEAAEEGTGSGGS